MYLDCWCNSARDDETRGSAISWLLTIVHRKAVDRVSSAGAAGRRDTTYTQQEQRADHDSTAESATASLDASRVRSALNNLTPKQRQAIELTFLGVTPIPKLTTAMLDLPPWTAKTRIRDGLIRLRETFAVRAGTQA